MRGRMTLIGCTYLVTVVGCGGDGGGQEQTDFPFIPWDVEVASGTLNEDLYWDMAEDPPALDLVVDDSAVPGEDATVLDVQADPQEPVEDAASAEEIGAPDELEEPPQWFQQQELADVPGAAWSKVADMDGDGLLDLVVSGFGTIVGLSMPNGTVTVFHGTGDLHSWDKEVVVTEGMGLNFPNEVSLEDVDDDGDIDIILAAGFLACFTNCGALLWFENTAAGWVQHDIVSKGSTDWFYHHGVLVDFDNDGVKDLVTVGEKKAAFFGSDEAKTLWFRGIPSGTLFDPQARIIGSGLGAVPSVLDIDGDGDLDVASAEFFHPGGSFAWFERTADPAPSNPTGTFVRHVISDQAGPSILLAFVSDLYGDGQLRAVGSNHTNPLANPSEPEAALFVFDIPGGAAVKQSWPLTQISSGITSVAGSMFAPMAAPGVFHWGDMDEDGDIDLIVSGDGDPNVYWFEQLPGKNWDQHVFATNMSQAGGMTIADLDDDGVNEIALPVYTHNKVYLYTK